MKKDIRAVTTDNASDMRKGLKKLCDDLSTASPGTYCDSSAFHVRCVSHVVNMAVVECMAVVHTHITKIRYLINSIRSSVKLRDIFNEVHIELEVNIDLPCMECETRWFSTLTMIRKSFT